MRRRFMVIAAVATGAVALAVAAGVVSSASGANTPSLRAWGLQPGVAAAPATQGIHRPQTLQLVLPTQTQTAVDNDPSGDSPGDEIIVHGPLVHEGSAIGVLDVRGTITSVSQTSERIQYTFTASLPNGQITSIGIVKLARNVTGFRAAVVGGTLHYRDVRGQVVVSFGQNGGARFNYQLIP